MRAWTMVMLSAVAIVAGCGGAAPPAPSTASADDPLTLPEIAIAPEALPGRLDGAWPLPIARGAHGWLLPFSDGGAVHARLIGDDGTRDDRFVERGTLVGAAALADGFAVVVAADGAARVHFLSSDNSDTVVSAPLDGDAVPAVASDGTHVLFGATHGGQIAVEQPTPLTATLTLVGRDGARVLDLGAVATAPVPWGDARGFIVSRELLVDGNGALALAPGHQVRDARIFRKPIAAGTQPTSDIISLDGDGWVAVDGLVGWAGRDDAGARLEVVTAAGRALVEVGEDLTRRSRRALPSTTRGDGGQAWVAAASKTHVVWASTVNNDPVFAMLDASAMQPTSGVVRLRHATSRTTIVSPGDG
ncbi:MAG: hypothetical protein LC659_05795, partial [Myxococcales bacterium]|nr:hypothetical protein [Myxococcales bacterium]